jgi:hypothetical protein
MVSIELITLADWALVYIASSIVHTLRREELVTIK